MWEYYPVICASMAKDFENVRLNSIQQPQCLVCSVPKTSHGESNSTLWQLRYYQQYCQDMILTTQHDKPERQEVTKYLKGYAVGSYEGIMWNMKCIFLRSIVVPDIHYTLCLSMHKHFMDCVISFIKQLCWITKANQL